MPLSRREERRRKMLKEKKTLWRKDQIVGNL